MYPETYDLKIVKRNTLKEDQQDIDILTGRGYKLKEIMVLPNGGFGFAMEYTPEPIYDYKLVYTLGFEHVDNEWELFTVTKHNTSPAFVFRKQIGVKNVEPHVCEVKEIQKEVPAQTSKSLLHAAALWEVTSHLLNKHQAGDFSGIELANLLHEMREKTTADLVAYAKELMGEEAAEPAPTTVIQPLINMSHY